MPTESHSGHDGHSMVNRPAGHVLRVTKNGPEIGEATWTKGTWRARKAVILILRMF